jgi:formate C-acetyltransferase
MGMPVRINKLLESHNSLKHTKFRTVNHLSIWDYGVKEFEPLVIRKAKALKLLLEETPPIIMENELIIGLRTIYSELQEGENVFGSDYLLPVKPATLHKKIYFPAYLTKKEKKVAQDAGIIEGASTSHVPFGTKKVLEKGIHGLIKNTEKRIDNLQSEKENQQKIDFLKAVIIVLKASTTFIKKHSEQALKLALECDCEKRKAELFQIAEVCQQISTEPPRNFYEAVQLFWLCSIIMAAENQSCIPIGRFDQDLWPYLRSDLDTKTITLELAQEIIECLWIKLNFESDLTTDTCRNITLSGTDKNGTDATNKLTYICLKASEKLRLADPKLNVRFHNNSPKRLWIKCIELVKTGLGGFPVFFKDELIIKSLTSMGVSSTDARSYSCDGCQEIIIPSKGDFYPVHTAVNLLECVQTTLGTKPTLVDIKESIKTSTDPIDYSTFDNFMKAYLGNLDCYIKDAVKNGNIRDKALGFFSPAPFLSSTLEGCIENAIDKTLGGCIYNWTGCNGQAFATAINSLAAIKKMVYDEKLISLHELRKQLEDDWPNERLRQYALNKVPKWGNDDDYVDSIAETVAKFFIDEVMKHENPRGGPYYPGIFTFHHVSRGIRTTASPDGRHSGDSLSAHLSPQAGTDKTSPTSTIKSAVKVFKLSPPEGAALDLRFHPTALLGLEGSSKLESFIKTFMELGGTVIQFNIVDSETLRKAQATPEEFRSLLVRVWGFSAYFITLTKEYQDEIIARKEHGFL